MDICYECLKPMTKKHGDITLTRQGYGTFKVIGVLHYGCNNCGAKVIFPEETERVEIEGVKLHMLATLKTKGPMTALALKGEIRSSTHILELAAKKLFKEKMINVDYTDVKMPVISLCKIKEKKLSLWNKFKAFIKRNKHNFY